MSSSLCSFPSIVIVFPTLISFTCFLLKCWTCPTGSIGILVHLEMILCLMATGRFILGLLIKIQNLDRWNLFFSYWEIRSKMGCSYVLLIISKISKYQVLWKVSQSKSYLESIYQDTDFLLELMECVLNNIVFLFQDKIFKQCNPPASVRALLQSMGGRIYLQPKDRPWAHHYLFFS